MTTKVRLEVSCPFEWLPAEGPLAVVGSGQRDQGRRRGTFPFEATRRLGHPENDHRVPIDLVDASARIAQTSGCQTIDESDRTGSKYKDAREPNGNHEPAKQG